MIFLVSLQQALGRMPMTLLTHMDSLPYSMVCVQLTLAFVCSFDHSITPIKPL
jgi:hypothetical protein